MKIPQKSLRVLIAGWILLARLDNAIAWPDYVISGRSSQINVQQLIKDQPI